MSTREASSAGWVTKEHKKNTQADSTFKSEELVRNRDSELPPFPPLKKETNCKIGGISEGTGFSEIVFLFGTLRPLAAMDGFDDVCSSLLRMTHLNCYEAVSEEPEPHTPVSLWEQLKNEGFFDDSETPTEPPKQRRKRMRQAPITRYFVHPLSPLELSRGERGAETMKILRPKRITPEHLGNEKREKKKFGVKYVPVELVSAFDTANAMTLEEQDRRYQLMLRIMSLFLRMAETPPVDAQKKNSVYNGYYMPVFNLLNLMGPLQQLEEESQTDDLPALHSLHLHSPH